MPDTKRILALMPCDPQYEEFYARIGDAIQAISPSISFYRLDDPPSSAPTILEHVYQAIEEADLIVCDISRENSNVIYELGFAHGRGKPVVIIKEQEHTEHVRLLFDLKGVRALFYSPYNINEFLERLKLHIAKALENPAAFANPAATAPSSNSVFISYCHQDRQFVDRLLVHLRPLEHEGQIDLWVDTQLTAGDKWKTEIECALKRARAAILMVTADFLASEFIVNNELPPLLANAATEGTRIIPVILKPCRFARDKDLCDFQAVNDPQHPVVTLDEGEQEAVFDTIAATVEKLIL